jgi:hypothetical protein
MAPLFAHYGVALWTPEAGGPVGSDEDHEQPHPNKAYAARAAASTGSSRTR